MDSEPFLVDIRINGTDFTRAMIDNGCLCYATISNQLATNLKLPRIAIPPRILDGVIAGQGQITHITYAAVDIHGHQQARVFFYIIPGQTEDIILGDPWLKDVDGHYSAKKGLLLIQSSGIECWNRAKPSLGPQSLKHLTISQASASELTTLASSLNTTIQAVSLSDIEKALKPKIKTDPKDKLPQQYQEYLQLFDRKLAEALPPHRPGIDHAIPLIKDVNGEDKSPPWGPLYGMNREELLVLRKTLTELLDKNFIRVSNSPAASPVLLVRKPGGGIRFCVDYRGLNAVTVKDRYPLPLIHETLRNVSRAKWFTKLDVIAAFHKIRVKKGDEWKTAFRTRFGLFEYLVTPFGLTSAPSTFQRYINETLKEYLDEFASAYIDDVLIYSDGSIEDHRAKVKKVLQKLQDAGLQCDIDKSEFEQTRVKYLGFIIEAGKGIAVDPEKVEAIRGWKAPTTVKGVRGFIGFANFYRVFIPDFSTTAKPLIDLTKKDAIFKWTAECQESFDSLKELFISAPILSHFDPDLETIVEADSSGYATGGVLLQRGKDGLLRPCAFLSQRLSPAESNYEIHDKELLAIIRCLKEWRAELRMVKEFKILTDHKNLRYFYKAQLLSERQMRWTDLLSTFNFTLEYRPGKNADQPDALSRREQDMPTGIHDERLNFRFRTLFNNNHKVSTVSHLTAATTELDFESPQSLFQEEELQQLWELARKSDTIYQQISQSVANGTRRLATEIKVQTSIAECHLDDRGLLCFRNRVWIPDSEPLKTKIIQNIHDSHITGHPGREATYAILSRRFFWPGAAKDVRRFLRNCTMCGRSTIWREKKHGLLKPMPIPERIWAEISIDFITELPPTGTQQATNCMVITDRMTKGVILQDMKDVSAEAVAERFVKCYYPYHGLPTAITSDRGPQFTSQIWRRICEVLKIQQRLSTGYHPQTDGATERANQEIEKILRVFITYAQDDWGDQLPIVAAAINNRDASSTGMSPFFFTHGYHIDPIAMDHGPPAKAGSRQEVADAFLNRLREAQDWAQAAIASAQDQQQEQANKSRKAAPAYRVGDKVWLDLRHIKTARPSKKLDWLHSIYTIKRVISSHSMELDGLPTGIHPVFHVDLLRLAADDPLPSQVIDDTQPPPLLVDGQLEYVVESILCAAWRPIAGGALRRKVFVKWQGYAEPCWEPLEEYEETKALDDFEALYGNAWTNDGPVLEFLPNYQHSSTTTL